MKGKAARNAVERFIGRDEGLHGVAVGASALHEELLASCQCLICARIASRWREERDELVELRDPGVDLGATVGAALRQGTVRAGSVVCALVGYRDAIGRELARVGPDQHAADTVLGAMPEASSRWV